MTNNKPILLVEDNATDARAAIRALTQARLANPVYHCTSGEEALDYLLRRGAHTDSSGAAIVLLDLNMPGMDGRDVLARVKNDPELKSTPVIVFTTSDDPTDIDDCYNAGANSYIVKPVGFDKLIKALDVLKEYWFEITILPHPPT